MESQVTYKSFRASKPTDLHRTTKDRLRSPMSEWRERQRGWFMVFNSKFNNISVISWRSVLLVEETAIPEENSSHWQTLSHNVVNLALRRIRTSVVIGTDCIGSCLINYHTITATTTPLISFINNYINKELWLKDALIFNLTVLQWYIQQTSSFNLQIMFLPKLKLMSFSPPVNIWFQNQTR